MDSNILSLLGIVIVIVGFALKLDAILIVVAALIVTALVGGLGLTTMLETLGSSFVANRGMSIFIIIMLVTGTLERNGLKEAAARLIKKIKNINGGTLLAIYGVFRTSFAAFNVSFGGVASFIRPIFFPMIQGSIEAKNLPANEEYEEDIKGMAGAMENITWFFGQNLFIGGAGALLVQSTLKGLGYDVSLVHLTLIEIPVAIVALLVAAIYFYLKDKKLMKKYFGEPREDR
ncbi:MAG: DUF969 domain-containing protein [Enterococcus sp.]